MITVARVPAVMAVCVVIVRVVTAVAGRGGGRDRGVAGLVTVVRVVVRGVLVFAGHTRTIYPWGVSVKGVERRRIVPGRWSAGG